MNPVLAGVLETLAVLFLLLFFVRLAFTAVRKEPMDEFRSWERKP